MKPRNPVTPRSSEQELLNMLYHGHRLQCQGRLAEAERIYRQVLQQSPGHPQGLYLLASIARQVGRSQDALRLLESARIARPEDPDILVALGCIFIDLQRWQDALEINLQATRVQPTIPEAFNNLGNVLLVQGRVEEAAEAYRKAVSMKPDYTDAWLHLGHVLKMLGDRKAAESAYRDALRLAPERAEIYRSMGQIKHYTDPRDPDILAMQALCARSDQPSSSKMHLHFALGKACDELGEPAHAFEHWRKANRLKRATYTYDIAEEVEVVRQIEAAFTPESLALPGDSGRPDARPIFVVGMPRSGTTLVEQILSSHPEVGGAGEVTELRRALQAHGNYLEGPVRYGLEAARQAAGEYLERMRFFDVAERPRLTDKSLFNFFYIGMIRLLFPNASVIACWRDPLDTCLSCYRHYFPDQQRFLYDLGELGRFYGLFARLMRHWRHSLPGFVHEVFHEQLVADPESETRRLLEFCGLSWNDACLRFHENPRAVKTTSATQVREPINRSGMGRWRPYSPWLGELRAGLLEYGDALPVEYRSGLQVDALDGAPLS